MRDWVACLFLLLFCQGISAQDDSEGYVVRDTASYTGMLEGGTFGVLTLDGVYVDTINLGFGLMTVPGGVVYQRVETIGQDRYTGIERARSDVFLFDGTNRTLLRTLLPDFDDWFSTASVIDSVFFYWGGDASLWGYSYDFRNGESKRSNTILYTIEFGVDGPYWTPPRREGELVRWSAGADHSVWTTFELEVVREQR